MTTGSWRILAIRRKIEAGRRALGLEVCRLAESLP
jgi:hypothetical protein